MRAVVQRVLEARVVVEGATMGEIGAGLLVLLGVEAGDGDSDVAYIADKIADLRIFEDAENKQNLSLGDVPGAAALVVSQFTLLGDTRKGRRPSYGTAAPPDIANRLYEDVVTRLRNRGIIMQTGVFRAHMHVHLVNDGPVTILLDSRRIF